MNDAEIADLYAPIYEDVPPPGAFDITFPVDGAYAAVKVVNGIKYVCFRGSTTFLDWVEDFSAFADPIYDPQLGWCHNGFLLGVKEIRTQLDVYIGKDPHVIVGHSLGAGHAAIYAGYRAADGNGPLALVMFGEPRPGCHDLATVLIHTPSRSYRNMDKDGHDLVTDVPFTLPPLLNYQHPKPLIDVSAAPAPDDRWGVFRFHHYQLYVKALHSLLDGAVP